MTDWGAIISAGVAISNQLLEEEKSDKSHAQSRENTILQLQDNERGRVAQAERQAEALANNLEIANIGAQTDLETMNKRIMGDVLLKQGEGQNNLMLEDFRSSANAPERFNRSADILAQVLSR